MDKQSINKGTELMLRRRKQQEPPSPVLNQLGTEVSFSLLKRKLNFKLCLSWEKLTDN